LSDSSVRRRLEMLKCKGLSAFTVSLSRPGTQAVHADSRVQHEHSAAIPVNKLHPYTLGDDSGRFADTKLKVATISLSENVKTPSHLEFLAGV